MISMSFQYQMIVESRSNAVPHTNTDTLLSPSELDQARLYWIKDSQSTG